MTQSILNHAKSYLGTVQGDSKHKDLINMYNAVKPRPVGYKMKYNDNWCAAFITVMADLADVSSIVGRECGVHRFYENFKKRGMWIGVNEPRAGDVVIFDWRKDGWRDHIGLVEIFDGEMVTVIEGNTARRVARRAYKYNDWRISGYDRPDYPSGVNNPKKPLITDELAHEVISGVWGNGDTRVQRLTDAGYDPTAVQKSVNRLISSNKSPLKLNRVITKEVIAGKWGDGDVRGGGY